MNPRSLRTRSLIAVLAVALPVLVIYAFASHAHVSYQLSYRLDGRMRHELTMLKEAVTRSHGDDTRLREIVEIMPIDSFPQRRLYGIWADGDLVLATENLPFNSAPTIEPGYSDLRAQSGAWRVLAEHLAPSAATGDRTITLVVADPLAGRMALIRGGALDTILPMLVAIPALILGVYIALLRSLRPLTHLADQIGHRSPDRLLPIETQSVPSEALPIAESVNALMSRLADSIDRERRFTADAAHELRTPLTALKAHAQVALRAQDEALRSETLRSIARTVNRTDRMISQLLVLARLDPGVDQLQADPVDLGRIAKQAAGDLQTQAEARQMTIRLDCDEKILVRGNAEALTILVRNILENAIQYSNAGEPIELYLSCENDATVLEVCDSGPGIPQHARGDVFRRFRRLPDAKASGTGLGLSIVQRIAELHGATVALAEGSNGAGLRVTVRFSA